MIKVFVKKKDDKIISVSIKGHADFADYGRDIVCATASGIAITTINACQKIKADVISFKKSDGFLEIEVKENNQEINILLNNMIDLLEELEDSYPKNIKVKCD